VCVIFAGDFFRPKESMHITNFIETSPNPTPFHVVIIDLANPTNTPQNYKDLTTAEDAASVAEQKNNQFFQQGIVNKRANIVVDIDPSAPINPGIGI
jgi:hypothetical protein